MFYGITLGLVAVAAWGNFETCGEIVENEAAALGAFARDISVLPEPIRTELITESRMYLDYLIEHAWTDSKVGQNSPEVLVRLQSIHKRLAQFEPRNERESVLFHKALDQLNSWTEKRSTRIASLNMGLPAILWWILILSPDISSGVPRPTHR